MVTKKAADYSKGMEAAHCGICKHFKPPSRCEIVSGVISRTYWCKYFAKRANGAKRS